MTIDVEVGNIVQVVDDRNLIVIDQGNTVEVAAVGAQGPTGPTGATGATGPQGPSGVISVTAPITNSGSSTSAVIGVNVGTTSATVAAGDRGLPTGGTTGQALVKSSTTDYATTWTALADARAVYSRPIVGRSLPRYTTAVTFNGAKTINALMYHPYPVAYRCTIDQIGIHVNTLGANTLIRLGIYQEVNDSTDLSLIVDAGTVDASSTGEKIITLSPAVTLPAGRIWIVYGATGSGAGNVRVRIQETSGLPFTNSQLTSSDIFGAAAQVARWSSGYAGGSLAATANPGGNSAEQPPLFFLRVASVG